MKKNGRVLLHGAIVWLLSTTLALASCTQSNTSHVFKNTPEDTITYQLRQLNSALKPYQIFVERADSLNHSPFWESYFFPTNHPNCPYDGQKTWPDSCFNFSNGSLSPIIEIVSALRMELPLLQKGHSSFYLFIQPYQIKGLLLLSSHQHKPKRPLIIFRGGIGSKADSFRAERHLLLSIAYHLGYHILFVGSSFNDDTLYQANFEKSGPFVDRELNLFLGSVFSSPELKEFFESIYLIGLSMSGAGALLTADASNSPFTSILLLCPFLDYPEISEPEKNPLDSNFLTQLWAKYRFSKSLSKLSPNSPPLFRLFEKMYSRQIQLINQENFLPNGSSNSSAKSFPLILKSRIQNLQIKTKTQALLTVSDDLVNPQKNDKILSSLGVPIKWLKAGYHCALNASYPSETIAQVFSILLDTYKK